MRLKPSYEVQTVCPLQPYGALGAKTMPHREPQRQPGNFEAVSTKRDNSVLRTFHDSERLALRRLQGNRRHTNHKLVTHTTLAGVPATTSKRVEV